MACVIDADNESGGRSDISGGRRYFLGAPIIMTLLMENHLTLPLGSGAIVI